MEQYICEEKGGLGLTAVQRTSLLNVIMMSTAVPVKDENGIPYLPRKQGAGLVQIQNAVKTNAFLLNTDNGRPKGEIGYNESGNYSFDFKAVSMSDSDIQYEPVVTVLTEDTVTQDGTVYMAQKARVHSDDEVTVSIPKKTALAANGGSEMMGILSTAKACQRVQKLITPLRGIIPHGGKGLGNV